MKIELKPFEMGWFRTRGGYRACIVNFCDGSKYVLVGLAMDKNACFHVSLGEDGRLKPGEESEFDLIKRLPACTGWDSHPKSELQMMADDIRDAVVHLQYVNSRASRVNAIEYAQISNVMGTLSAVADRLEKWDRPPL